MFCLFGTFRLFFIAFFDVIEHCLITGFCCIARRLLRCRCPQKEYASVVFLKWFTEAERNLRFSSLSGYLPVKKEANDIARLETALSVIDQKDVTENLRASLRVAVDTVNQASLYTNKAFQGGTDARNVLETSLSDKAAADRLAIRDQIGSGVSRAAAVAQYDNDENFQAWFSSLKRALDESIK